MALSDDDVREILRIIDDARPRRAADRDEGVLAARSARGGPARMPVPADPPERLTPDRGTDANGSVTIEAPMLGTFYRAEAPGAPPFVELGSRVEPDTIVCIIEVMKMMNSVPAGVSGVVTEVLRRERRAGRVRGAAVPGAAADEARVHRQPRRDRGADRARVPRRSGSRASSAARTSTATGSRRAAPTEPS